MPGIFGRHGLVDIIGGDSSKQFAPQPIHGNNGWSAIAFGESAFANIQTQVGLTGIFILPVTSETIS